jgi:hypothetical protein
MVELCIETEGLESQQSRRPAAQDIFLTVTLPCRCAVDRPRLATALAGVAVDLPHRREHLQPGWSPRERGCGCHLWLQSSGQIFWIVAGGVLVCAVVGMRYFRFDSAMPVAGSCSVAIAAACHAPGGERASQGLLQWGKMGSDWNVADVGHDAFTDRLVKRPTVGRNFTFPPGVVPEDPNDERYLVFTAGGIDIRDTFGTTLGLEVDESSFKLRVATIPVHQLIRILADHPTRKSARTTLETKDGERA